MAVFGDSVGHQVEATHQFASDVDEGLSGSPKKISSKYFYDKAGDALFVKIMHMPEYYLTRSEFEIFSQQTQELIDAFDFGDQPFQLIELGAGDGTKTIELLRGLGSKPITYVPIDISKNALNQLSMRLSKELPDLTVEPQQGEYFEALGKLQKEVPKVVLFLGSNMGNLLDDQAKEFLKGLSEAMGEQDKLLLGLDLKKSTELVLPAYNDAQGYTREFNLNVLRRINRELGADFDVSGFQHLPSYDEQTGVASSHLLCTKQQSVTIAALNKTFQFEEGEEVHTEISRKYDLKTLEEIISTSGLKVKTVFKDSNEYFMDVLLGK
jgi:L-histidine N-alpha-methyltransferase